MRWATVLMVCSALCWSGRSLADGPRRFSLEYRGSPSCQKEAELLAEIRRRTPTALLVATEAADVRIRLTIDDLGGKQRAHIELDGPDGASERELEAPECAQLDNAVALILAIAIDPDAPPPAREESTDPEPVAASQAPAPRRLAERGAAPPSVWWAVGAGVGLMGGVAPHPALAERVSVEFGRGHDSGLSAHLKLSVMHAHGDVSTYSGTADFDLLALRLASCPYRAGARVSFSACLSFDFGRLQGRGSRTLAEQTGSARWYGPGAVGVAELRVRPWLRVQLELGALAPLARDHFYFGPSETVHQIPTIAGYGGLNLLVGG